MSRYFKTENSVDRLFDDWQKYKRLVLAVDFDDTVFDTHNNGDTYEIIFTLLKRCQALNFYIVVFTASRIERYNFIESHFKENGITIASINKNPIDLPYGTNGKIFYNHLLDDRAGLGQSIEILERLLNKIENFKVSVDLGHPRNLNEAVEALGKLMEDSDDFKKMNEDEAIALSHHGIGRYLRNSWHLWWNKELYEEIKDHNKDYPSVKPAIVEFFNSYGITHADDMSGIILTSFHRQLNGNYIRFEDQIKKYQDFWLNNTLG